MSPRSSLVTVTFFATTLTGCYSTWDIDPKSGVHLDGFREGQTRLLWTAGETPRSVEFTSDTELHFRGDDNLKGSAKFRSIEVQGTVLQGVESEQGRPVTVDLSRVVEMEAKKFSVGKTVGLSVGLGLGIPAAYTFTMLVIALSTSTLSAGGRPLRASTGASPIRAPFILNRQDRAGRRTSRGQRAQGVDAATRASLFAHWAKEASSECASIPAFLALARDLRLASAPSALVDRALRAAREEASHTELCTALANEHAPAPMSAWIPPTPPSTDVDRRALIERLAMEAFWDGCVAEGVAAAVARRSARDATEEAAGRALQTIARDEQGHADLSRQIVAYCLSAGGRPVRDALVESLAARRAEEEALLDRSGGDEGGPRIDERFAQARGLPGDGVERAARAEVWEKNLSMLASL